MTNVRLRVSMICDGVFLRVGSVVDLAELPQSLTLKKYVERVSHTDTPIPIPLSPHMPRHSDEKEEESEEVGPSPSREKELRDFVKRIPKGER